MLNTANPGADLHEGWDNPDTVWKCYDRSAARKVWERVATPLSEAASNITVGEPQLDSPRVSAHLTATTSRR